MITITVKGDVQLQQFFERASADLRKTIAEALQQAASMIKDEATWNCPVKTGFLRSTIFYRIKDELSYTVGASAYYAGYVEYGTRYMYPRSFLRPAFIYVTNTIQSAFTAKIEEAINRMIAGG